MKQWVPLLAKMGVHALDVVMGMTPEEEKSTGLTSAKRSKDKLGRGNTRGGQGYPRLHSETLNPTHQSKIPPGSKETKTTRLKTHGR